MTEQQFSWTWTVQVIAAVGTFLAVVVAVFGDWIRSRLFRPSLGIELATPKGERAAVGQAGVTGLHPARYYYFRVSNTATNRWPHATSVMPHLVRIEEPAADGSFQLAWQGDVLLQWRRIEVGSFNYALGPPQECHLCSVFNTPQGPRLQLHPVVKPLIFTDFFSACRLRLFVQARSDQVDSELACFEVSWDGVWIDGESEMATHLVVKRVDVPTILYA